MDTLNIFKVTHCNMDDADLRNRTINIIKVTHCNLIRADLRGSHLNVCNVAHFNMNNAKVAGMTIRRFDLTPKQLEKVQDGFTATYLGEKRKDD